LLNLIEKTYEHTLDKKEAKNYKKEKSKTVKKKPILKVATSPKSPLKYRHVKSRYMSP